MYGTPPCWVCPLTLFLDAAHMVFGQLLVEIATAEKLNIFSNLRVLVRGLVAHCSATRDSAAAAV